MRHRALLPVIGLCCLNAVAWAQATAPARAPNLTLTSMPPAAASTVADGYRDTLSSAASNAQRFNFNDGSGKDKAPPDQSPIRVIINNGRGPNVNCVPMGPGAACH